MNTPRPKRPPKNRASRAHGAQGPKKAAGTLKQMLRDAPLMLRDEGFTEDEREGAIRAVVVRRTLVVDRTNGAASSPSV